jgi:hypothetical protein
MRIIIARSFLSSSSLSFFLREARAIDVRIKRNETRTVFEPFVHFFAFEKCSHVQIIAHRPRFRDRERDKPSGCVRSRASFQSLAFFLSGGGGSFLEKKRDEKQLSHKNKNKKNIDIPNTNFFLIKGTAAYTTANHLRTTTTTFGDGSPGKRTGEGSRRRARITPPESPRTTTRSIGWRTRRIITPGSYRET